MTSGKPSISWPLGVSLTLISGVWGAGAVWSFDHQRRFAESLGFHHDYLLPAVADGLPVAMASVAFSASLDGRPAPAARLGTALAVAGSAVSNGMYAWERSGHHLTTVIVAVAIPVLAAIAFEILLGEIRKRVMQTRGKTPPAPVPHLRPIRVLLDPRREVAQWRRHVLTVTDPAADPVERAVLSRLVDAVSQHPVSHPGAGGVGEGNGVSRVAAAPETAVVTHRPYETYEAYEAPRWLPETAPAEGTETVRSSSLATASETPGVGGSETSRSAAVVLAGQTAQGAQEQRGVYEAPRWNSETPPVETRSSRETAPAEGTETVRSSLATASETPGVGGTETSRSVPGEMSRPSRSAVSRPRSSRPAVSRPAASRPAVSPAPTSRSETSAVQGSHRSQRAAMTAYAIAQQEAGVEITGADLDREFGTKNYGRAVLRDLKAARARAGETPPAAGEMGGPVPVGAGVSDG